MNNKEEKKKREEAKLRRCTELEGGRKGSQARVSSWDGRKGPPDGGGLVWSGRGVTDGWDESPNE